KTIVEQNLDRLGGNSAGVRPSYDLLEAEPTIERAKALRGRITDPVPPTTNPSAEAFEFVRADPERDVGEVLEMYASIAPDAPRLDLRGVMTVALESARDYRFAKEELLLAALRLVAERHRWGPRFFNDVSAVVDADAEDGDYDTALQLVNEFRATQRLPYGGDVEARLLVRATEQLRERVSSEPTQSASFIVYADLPLLRGAGITAREDLISAEREMVYATRTFERFRREFLFDIARDYFDLLRSAASIRNAERVLESRRKLLSETQAFFEKGRSARFEVSEARQRVLVSENRLASQRDAFILQLERFRVRLGLDPGAPLSIDTAATFNLPVPELDMAVSITRGLAYRLDLQNERDSVDDSYRGILIARNTLLPELDLSGSMEMITNPDLNRAGLQFDADETDFIASITLGLPIDREIERVQMRQSLIRLERAVRDYEERKDEIALSIRAAIRDIELALFSLQLQNENIRITERRLEGLELRDDVPPRTIIDAQDDLIEALDARDNALRELRVAILRYLLETGQFRVDVGGQFLPPPGLEPLSEAELEELGWIQNPAEYDDAVEDPDPMFEETDQPDRPGSTP
ncbi:MAG: TolC family protein, partial [Planctomycetota bacterium]